MTKVVAVDFTESELREWCARNDVSRRTVINARRLQDVLGHRGPGELIFGHTAASEYGVRDEARRRGFRQCDTPARPAAR